MVIANFKVRKTLLNSVNVIETFQRMKLPLDQLTLAKRPLYGFTGELVVLEGKIGLLVFMETYPKQVSMMVDFLVIKVLFAYNTIIG